MRSTLFSLRKVWVSTCSSMLHARIGSGSRLEASSLCRVRVCLCVRTTWQQHSGLVCWRENKSCACFEQNIRIWSGTPSCLAYMMTCKHDLARICWEYHTAPTLSPYERTRNCSVFTKKNGSFRCLQERRQGGMGAAGFLIQLSTNAETNSYVGWQATYRSDYW